MQFLCAQLFVDMLRLTEAARLEILRKSGKEWLEEWY